MGDEIFKTLFRSWRANRGSADRRALDYVLPDSGNGRPGRFDYYLVTATIVRDEARFLREFVAFHQVVGVDHMLIYDDGSKDGIDAALAPFIETGFVELIRWPRFIADRNNQYLAYQHAVSYLRSKAFWIAMIDADEFLFAPGGKDLKRELRNRERFPALGVYSRTFGTSGLDEIPSGRLVTELLVRRQTDDYYKNNTQRTIVQPQFVRAIRSANTVLLHGEKALGWDEVGCEIVRTGEPGHPSNDLRINHYFTRARKDFERKIARGYFGKTAWESKMGGKRNEAHEVDQANIDDTEIHRLLPELKSLLANVNGQGKGRSRLLA